MALKFLNKKGWHTGSLRNIENVWKAEQKQAAEEKKLEELRKQIQEERERAEFRQLQEQAGLIPRQERLEFLYDSGLAVGKGTSNFKALDTVPKTEPEAAASSSSATAAKQQSTVPGSLFEDKPQSANDAWRKLHSDPLLMIRQKEQEALSRIKNNPVQMAMIRKSVRAKKNEDENRHEEKKKHKKKHHHKSSKHRTHSSSPDCSDSEDFPSKVEEHKKDNSHRYSKHDEPSHRASRHSNYESSERDVERKRSYHREYRERESSSRDTTKRNYDIPRRREYSPETRVESSYSRKSHVESSDTQAKNESKNRRRKTLEFSEEERAAMLREMQMDAEIHEEERWKRLKKAEERDTQEAIRDQASKGRNFLDAAHKSVYGAEKGGSSTIEESVRRRTHYLQSRSDAETNAFRR